MPGLLDLPREIRDEILGLALSSISLPADAEASRYRRLDWPGTTVCYPKPRGCVTLNALNLLLVNSQIHAETSEYIERVGPALAVDIVIVDAHWLWPTWRCIPTRRATVFERVDINVIHCCSERERSLQTNFNPEYSTGGTWQFKFWHFVNRLLSGRPWARLGEDVVFDIRTLIINIDTAKGEHLNRTLTHKEVPIRKIEHFKHLVFDSLYPLDPHGCTTTLKCLYSALDLSLQTKRSHRLTGLKFISERVGRVMFTRDDKFYLDLNVGDFAFEDGQMDGAS